MRLEREYLDMDDRPRSTEADAISGFLQEVARVGSHSFETTLRRDLKIDGRRAHKVMEAFAAKFEVDMASYDHRRFFTAYDLDFGFLTPDYTWVFLTLNPHFRRAWHAAQAYEVSVGHLAAVADKKVWFDPAPEAHPPAIEVSSPFWQRLFSNAWTLLRWPYRLFSIVLIAAVCGGVLYSVVAALGAALQQQWMGVFAAIFAGGSLALFGAVLLAKTAKRIQARLGAD